MKKVTILMITTLLLLTGCADLESKEKGVIENNKHVESVMSSYEESKENSRDVEVIFKEALKTSDVTLIKELKDKYGHVFNRDVTNIFNEMDTIIEETIRHNHEIVSVTREDILEQLSVDESISDSELLAYLTSEGNLEGTTITPNEIYILQSKILNRDTFIETITEVYYFLDDDTGKTEQMFLFRLPNGVIKSVSFVWIGGVYLEAKTFGIY